MAKTDYKHRTMTQIANILGVDTKAVIDALKKLGRVQQNEGLPGKKRRGKILPSEHGQKFSIEVVSPKDGSKFYGWDIDTFRNVSKILKIAEGERAVDTIDRLFGLNQELGAEIDRLRKLVAARDEEIRTLWQARREQQEADRLLSEERRALQAKVSSLQEDLEHAQADLSEARSELSSLEERLEESRGRLY